ncbi:hypothetical protein BX600DRAFT_148347 [Xylariales sp. PMI_506]|nr:hypothetical protein BX600DRAFT_148347 [Xylariales sp. PMI_506]
MSYHETHRRPIPLPSQEKSKPPAKMVSIKSLAVAAFIVAGVQAATPKNALFAALIERQSVEPGTDLYNCHDNCGEAILESESSSDVCSDTIFLTDYDNCLQCSGPDNENIWQYYGPELTSAAAACSLATTPVTTSTTSTIQSALQAVTAASNATVTTASVASTVTATATVATAVRRKLSPIVPFG